MTLCRLTDSPHHPERARGKVGYDLHEDDQVSREGEGEFMPDLISRCERETLVRLSSNTHFRKSVELIEKQNSSQPFFLYVSYQSAHSPISRPPQRYLDKYLRARSGSASHYNKRGPVAHLHRAATITVRDKLLPD